MPNQTPSNAVTMSVRGVTHSRGSPESANNRRTSTPTTATVGLLSSDGILLPGRTPGKPGSPPPAGAVNRT
ncbi:hypothetical protein GCM10014719_30210 [Planomonospora parontospora subsp. antibiotica]|nr:hypothetical protein GCM10014719_30210 [Planomonospora parontospora subsp. antibiotica]GII16120.1 hypothetical protein Ppa05_28460 [Planomonospora parontospora subsp. antibiotica]